MGNYFGVLGGQGYRVEGSLEGSGAGEGAFLGNGRNKKTLMILGSHTIPFHALWILALQEASSAFVA